MKKKSVFTDIKVTKYAFFLPKLHLGTKFSVVHDKPTVINPILPTPSPTIAI